MPLTHADGRLRITVLTAKPADLTAITLTELNAGIYAGGRINKPDYRLTPVASDTVPDQPIENSGNATTFGNSNYEGAATVFRFLDENGVPVEAEDVLWDAVSTKGTRLWVVEREGPPARQDNAVGDLYEVYEVETDLPQKPTQREGYIKRTVPMGVQDYETGAVVAGGGG